MYSLANSEVRLEEEEQSIAKRKKCNHSLNRSIFCIGMVYFEWYLANPHVKAVLEMCGKGGQRVL